MDAIDAYRRDMDLRHEAEGEDAAPVAKTWRGEDVYPGDDILELSTGDILMADVDEMKAYLKYRMRVLGGLEKWVAFDLYEGDATSLVLAMLSDPLTLDEIFEDYYDANRMEA